MTTLILRRHCRQLFVLHFAMYSPKSRGKHSVRLDDISTWKEDNVNVDSHTHFKDFKYTVNDEINSKMSIFVGDITTLEVDAIVNAANNALKGGGGVDGAIHQAAGHELLVECSKLGGCETGSAKVTKGYALPAGHVIHTVGPVGEKQKLLQQCYEHCLLLAKENNFHSIAFPCISTGVYMYPNEKAAHVALKVAREWMEINSSCMARIIFCLFMQTDVDIYKSLMHLYFPVKLEPKEN